MDAHTRRFGKSAGLRQWFAEHSVAVIATAMVLAVLGWKNQYNWRASSFIENPIGDYGWPLFCVERRSELFWDAYIVTSWPALLVDSSVAAGSLIATWILFSLTQRRCPQWWQFSLAFLLAFVLLAAVLCAVMYSQSS